MPCPFTAFGSTDADSLVSCIATNINSVDPFNHAPPCAPASLHTNVHAGSPAVSTLPAFHGKPVNPAPILGLAPPPRGPPRGPPSGATGHLSSLARSPAPSGPPSCPGPPVLPPSGPLFLLLVLPLLPVSLHLLLAPCGCLPWFYALPQWH